MFALRLVATGAAATVLATPDVAAARSAPPEIRHGFPTGGVVAAAAVPVDTAFGTVTGPACALRLDEQVNGGRWRVVAQGTGSLLRYPGRLTPGGTYRYRATKSCAGRASTHYGRRFAVRVIQDDSRAFRYTKPEGKNEGLSPWEVYRSPEFLGGTAHGTPDVNNGTVRFSGFAAGWVGSTPEDEGPVAGIAVDRGPEDRMQLGNKLVPPHAFRRVLWSSRTLPAGAHSARFVVYDDTATVDAFVVLTDR